jgi:hypothetical protein
MAVQKEEVILDFKVEQGDVVSDLEKLKRVILANKQEQIELNKAFKAGQITQAEYVKETVRVENSLKRQQKQYNDTQKAVLGHKSKIDELIKSNQKLTEAVKNVGQNLNIAGVNVGSLTTRLTSLANPTTLAAAAAGALATAYASSTVGARDLAFASDQLSFVTGKLSEDLGRLVGGEDGGGGKGLLSQLSNKYLELIQFVPLIKGLDLVTGNAVSEYIESLRKGSEEAAKALEKLRDIEISLAFAKGFFKEDERKIEIQRRERDDELKSLNDRIAAVDKINSLFEAAEIRSKSIIQSQIQAIKDSTIGYDNNREAQLSVAKLEAEILDLQEMVNGKLTENLKIRQQLLAIAESEAAIARINAAVSPAEQARILQQRSQVRAGVAAGDGANTIAGSVDSRQVELQKTLANARVNLTQDAIDRQIESERLYTDFIVAENQARLNATAGFFGALSGIFKQGSEEQKGLALFQIAIDSAVGVSGAIKAGAGIPFPGNLAAILTGVTTVLSGIAQARQLLGFQTGGYTGDGNPHDVAGVVHKKEVVWNAQDVSMMGGPSVVNAMRPTARYRHSRGGGYYDGGIVAKSASNEVNQQLAMINAIKAMPPPVVSAVEMTKAQNRVIVKQNISKR